MKKPIPSDFNAPNITIQNLEQQIKQHKPVSNDFALGHIFGAGSAAIVIFFAFKSEGNFEFWMIIGGAFVWFLINGLFEFLQEYVFTNKEVDAKIEKLNLAIQNRRKFEIALSDWEYLNLTSNQGFWLRLKGIALENEVAKVFETRGWKVAKTKVVGDGGIDLICTKDGEKFLIQCKGHAKPVGVAAVRDAAGVKLANNAKNMVVISPAGFTQGSVNFAQNTRINLMSAYELTNFVVSGKIL